MYIQLHVHCILIQLHPKKSMGEYITGTCPNCYGTKLVENLDELSCTTCGHRIEGHLSLNVVEGNDIFSGFRQASQSQSQLRRRKEFLQSQEGIDTDGGIMNNNNKVKEFLSKKRRRKEELKKTDVHYFNYLEAMQFILRQQIEALISKCGVTKNIRNTVFEIFFKYTETCITENVDFADYKQARANVNSQVAGIARNAAAMANPQAYAATMGAIQRCHC